MGDLISRQAAIDALHRYFPSGFDNDRWWNSTHVIDAINSVPSAQPEWKCEHLEPIPVCKYRLPCGNCDDLDMPCPVICQPWKEGEK